MTVYLTPFILIGALVVLGVLVGLGLVLLTVRRERRDVRAVVPSKKSSVADSFAFGRLIRYLGRSWSDGSESSLGH